MDATIPLGLILAEARLFVLLEVQGATKITWIDAAATSGVLEVVYSLIADPNFFFMV